MCTHIFNILNICFITILQIWNKVIHVRFITLFRPCQSLALFQVRRNVFPSDFVIGRLTCLRDKYTVPLNTTLVNYILRKVICKQLGYFANGDLQLVLNCNYFVSSYGSYKQDVASCISLVGRAFVMITDTQCNILIIKRHVDLTNDLPIRLTQSQYCFVKHSLNSTPMSSIYLK